MSQTSASTVQEGQHIYIGADKLEPKKNITTGPLVATVLKRERVSTFGYVLTLKLAPTGEEMVTQRLDLHEKFTLFE